MPLRRLARLHHVSIDHGPGKRPAVQVLRVQPLRLHREAENRPQHLPLQPAQSGASFLFKFYLLNYYRQRPQHVPLNYKVKSTHFLIFLPPAAVPAPVLRLINRYAIYTGHYALVIENVSR